MIGIPSGWEQLAAAVVAVYRPSHAAEAIRWRMRNPQDVRQALNSFQALDWRVEE